MTRKEDSMSIVLSDVLEEMEEIKGLSKGDAEAGHSMADEQLTDLVDFFGKHIGRKQEVRKILKVYDEVYKWYA